MTRPTISSFLCVETRKLTNRSLVGVETCRLSPYGPPVPALYVLMSWANGGSLQSYIDRRRGEPDPGLVTREERVRRFRTRNLGAVHLLRLDEILSIFEDCCQGLGFLHDRNILHLDLKVSTQKPRHSADTNKFAAGGQCSSSLGRRCASVRLSVPSFSNHPPNVAVPIRPCAKISDLGSSISTGEASRRNRSESRPPSTYFHPQLKHNLDKLERQELLTGAHPKVGITIRKVESCVLSTARRTSGHWVCLQKFEWSWQRNSRVLQVSFFTSWHSSPCRTTVMIHRF